jgi:hypothetical protein
MKKSKRHMKKRHAVHAQNKTLHVRKNGAAWREVGGCAALATK